MAEQNNHYILQMRNITKRFPGTLALDQVNFNLAKGEVHALVGENGAGKSTLIKILTGVYKPDSGEIVLDEQSMKHMDPAHSLLLGIHFVYQEPNLFPLTSVLENLFLTDESFYKRGFVQRKKAIQRAKAVFKELNLEINLNQFVHNLTRGQKQMVSIARAMISLPKVLVLDEPTASLTAGEISSLFKAVKNLQKEGVSVIYISHRLQEIFEVAQRITILRDGKNVGFHDVKDVDLNTIITGIVAKSIKDKFPKEELKIGKEVLSVEGLSSSDGAFQNVSFKVHEGEIFGIAGVIGSGKSALGQVLFGLLKKKEGQIFLNGKEINLHSSRDAIREGIVLVPEDRRAHGIVASMNVRENIALPNADAFSNAIGWMRRTQTKKIAQEYKKRLSIRTPSVNQLVEFLSGGNQQKVVVAKWLCSKAKVFIFAEITAGIDVGAKTEIYRLLNEICRQGGVVILISSEFEELLGMCGRIMILYEGKVSIEKNIQELNIRSLFRYAVGEGSEVDEMGAIDIIEGGNSGNN